MQTWAEHRCGYTLGPSSKPLGEGGAEVAKLVGAAAPPLAPLGPTFGRAITLVVLRSVTVGLS